MICSVLNKVPNPGQNEGQSYPLSMTYNLLNKERNLGHSSIITGSNGGRREKSNDWLYRPFSAKMIPFCQRKFSSGQTLARDRRQFSQAPGKSPVKRLEQNLWTEVSRKG